MLNMNTSWNCGEKRKRSPNDAHLVSYRVDICRVLSRNDGDGGFRVEWKRGKVKVLVACEFSGIVREAFARRGHDAMSCDLLPTEIPGKHYQGDVMDIINDRWDLMIAHPPCTRLANSGVRWLYERSLWGEMFQAIEFFLNLQNADIPLITIENPIQHKYARDYICKYDQIIQPWMFGHGETKATCLWLKGLPKLKPTNIVSGRDQRLHRLPPGPERWRERSRTFQGIADAMAEQWGNL